jgi:hypothetical protein
VDDDDERAATDADRWHDEERDERREQERRRPAEPSAQLRLPLV